MKYKESMHCAKIHLSAIHAFTLVSFLFFSFFFFYQSSHTGMHSSGIMNIFPFCSLNPFAFNYLMLTSEKDLTCFAIQFFHWHSAVVCHQNCIRLLKNSAGPQSTCLWMGRLMGKQFKKKLVNIGCIFL